jgi:hypothetical protein
MARAQVAAAVVAGVACCGVLGLCVLAHRLCSLHEADLRLRQQQLYVDCALRVLDAGLRGRRRDAWRGGADRQAL